MQTWFKTLTGKSCQIEEGHFSLTEEGGLVIKRFTGRFGYDCPEDLLSLRQQDSSPAQAQKRRRGSKESRGKENASREPDRSIGRGQILSYPRGSHLWPEKKKKKRRQKIVFFLILLKD